MSLGTYLFGLDPFGPAELVALSPAGWAPTPHLPTAHPFEMFPLVDRSGGCILQKLPRMLLRMFGEPGGFLAQRRLMGSPGGQCFTPEHKAGDVGVVGQWKAEWWLTCTPVAHISESEGLI